MKIKYWIIIIGFILAIGVGTYKEITYEPMFSETLFNSNLSSKPRGLIINVDYVNFTDGNLTLSTTEPFYFTFNDIDYIKWNIKNETYIYRR